MAKNRAAKPMTAEQKLKKNKMKTLKKKAASREAAEEQRVTGANSMMEAKLGAMLTHVEKGKRDRALALCKKYLQLKAATMPRDEFLKLWKAFFYSLWLSDLKHVQQMHSVNLAELADDVPAERRVEWIGAMLETVTREWAGLDYHRIDKYELFLRINIAQTFKFVRLAGWDPELLKELGEVYREQGPLVNSAVAGPALHFFKCFWEELSYEMKVDDLDKLSNKATGQLVAPLIGFLATGPPQAFMNEGIKTLQNAPEWALPIIHARVTKAAGLRKTSERARPLFYELLKKMEARLPELEPLAPGQKRKERDEEPAERKYVDGDGNPLPKPKLRLWVEKVAAKRAAKKAAREALEAEQAAEKEAEIEAEKEAEREAEAAEEEEASEVTTPPKKKAKKTVSFGASSDSEGASGEEETAPEVEKGPKKKAKTVKKSEKVLKKEAPKPASKAVSKEKQEDRRVHFDDTKNVVRKYLKESAVKKLRELPSLDKADKPKGVLKPPTPITATPEELERTPLQIARAAQNLRNSQRLNAMMQHRQQLMMMRMARSKGGGKGMF